MLVFIDFYDIQVLLFEHCKNIISIYTETPFMKNLEAIKPQFECQI